MPLSQTLSNVKVVREPYPYIVIDNFLDLDLAYQVESEFPTLDQMPRHSPDHGLLDGWHTNPQDALISSRPGLNQMFKFLESAEFRTYMREVFGVEQPLFFDPQYQGAGLLAARKGGVHKIHRDRNRHLDTHFYRRLTLLVYFNIGWRSGYGGELNLWDKEIQNNIMLPPLFNRCIVFENTQHAFHSISEVNMPEGMIRKAINFYYYTEHPAPSERHTHVHNTEFFASPGERWKFWKYIATTRFPMLLLDTAINRNEFASKFLQKSGIRRAILELSAAFFKATSPAKYTKLMKSDRWHLYTDPDRRLIRHCKEANNS
jgi:hypothetical protein